MYGIDLTNRPPAYAKRKTVSKTPENNIHDEEIAYYRTLENSINIMVYEYNWQVAFRLVYMPLIAITTIQIKGSIWKFPTS